MHVRGHANARSRMKMKPSGMDAAGFEPEGGGSQFGMINHAEQGGPKQVRHEKSWQLRPVCPQFIAKANPTPASKRAFTIRIKILVEYAARTQCHTHAMQPWQTRQVVDPKLSELAALRLWNSFRVAWNTTKCMLESERFGSISIWVWCALFKSLVGIATSSRKTGWTKNMVPS